MPFGTGGRRGGVGIGPNRMNLWTLGASVQGHCEYSKPASPAMPSLCKSCSPMTCANSRTNARCTIRRCPTRCCTCRAATSPVCRVRLCRQRRSRPHPAAGDSKRYLATPELSFAIRLLQAHGGLNISASHNPPDDNGGKFYDERGGQPVPPDDQIMSRFRRPGDGIKALPWADAVRSGRIHWLDDAAQGLHRPVPAPSGDRRRRASTNSGWCTRRLHGVGSHDGAGSLASARLPPIPVPEQMEPNGQFPNVTKSPNPEVPESLDRAEAVARRQNQARPGARHGPGRRPHRRPGPVMRTARATIASLPAMKSAPCSRITSWSTGQEWDHAGLADRRDDGSDHRRWSAGSPAASGPRSSTICWSASNTSRKCSGSSNPTAPTKTCAARPPISCSAAKRATAC
jgi:hypothetical protein